MALPKEPRQKMINIMYLVLTAILALNVSNEVIEAFKTVDKSLQGSNTSLGSSTSETFKSLSRQMTESKTADQAKIWQPKAEQAIKYSKDLTDYIESLKVQLKNGAGLKIVTKDGKQVEDFKEDNLDASTRIFETGGEGKKLEAALIKYKKDILGIDKEIDTKFAQNFPVDLTPMIGRDGKEKTFTTGYFHMTPTVAALTMLSKFQNNVKNAESQVVSFCQSKVGAVEFVYDQFKPIIGTSSTYLMPGEEMEVTAGIGSFSKDAAPTITINGVSQAANADGVAIRKFPVSGSGTVNVVMTFTKPDGSKGTETRSIPYTVGVPGGSAVMLDKMNVFYIGVDNPVTISSGKGWDKTSVSANGCTLSGTGGKRTVRVTGGTSASITVSAEGSGPSVFNFRVKRIPDPVFKVGDGKIRMPAVAFKAQDFCRAELENFDFDTKYNITSATVYFSGAGFQSVQTSAINSNSLASVKALMARCIPGSVISFDNVKVSGPDGSRTIDGKSIALY